MVKHIVREDVHRRNIPPVDFELVDVDPRPLDVKEVKKKAYI